MSTRLLQGAVALTVAASVLVASPVAAKSKDSETPHFLVFSGTYGFRHEGIQESVAQIRHMGRMTGAYTIEWSEDPSIFQPSLYERIDGVVMLQTTGIGGSEGPLDARQRRDFARFFECGGAFVGVHAAADSGGQWSEYNDLIGAVFDSHPHFSFEQRDMPISRSLLNPSLLTDVWIDVPDQTHRATAPWHGTDRFRITEELYRWQEDPRDLHASDPEFRVLLSLDVESHYWPKDVPPLGGVIPVPNLPLPNPIQLIPPLAFPVGSPLAWTKSYGQGRVFYTNLGHNVSTWERADFQGHMFEGMVWATGQRPDAACIAGEDLHRGGNGVNDGDPQGESRQGGGPTGQASPDAHCSRNDLSGGDWPTYGRDLMASHNQWDENRIGPGNVSELELQWVIDDEGYQSIPIVAGGCLYHTSGGYIRAVDLDTGQELWKTKEELRYTASPQSPIWSVVGQFVGSEFSPFAVAVEEGRVHVNFENEGAPKGAAFDAHTGDRLWISEGDLNFGYRADQLSSAVVYDGIHLIHSAGPDFDPQVRPGYALFDASDGSTLHRQTVIPPHDLDRGYAGGGVWGTPSVDPVTRHAFVGTANPKSKNKEHRYDNAIIKIDLDRDRDTFGQVVGAYKGQPDTLVPWGYNTPVCELGGDDPPLTFNILCLQQDIDFGNGPTMWRNEHGELMLAQLQKSGLMHALYADTMTPAWTLQIGTHNLLTATGGNHSQAANDGERVYVAANPGLLWALDAETGRIEWVVPSPFPMQGMNVAVANGVVYSMSLLGVHAWEAETGLPLWSYVLPDAGLPCATVGSGIAVANNTLIVHCNRMDVLPGAFAAFRLPS